MQKRTLDEEVAFTREWWTRINKDPEKLYSWLKKLYGTEMSGYYEYFDYIKMFPLDDRNKKIFTNIALDELKHGGLIQVLLAEHGHALDPNPPESVYWNTMNEHIVDLPSAAAVNYFGEALAAFRFEVIIDRPETSSDVKEMLSIILPDEQFHRTALKRMAGDEVLAKFEAIHEDAVCKLIGQKISDVIVPKHSNMA